MGGIVCEKNVFFVECCDGLGMKMVYGFVFDYYVFDVVLWCE